MANTPKLTTVSVHRFYDADTSDYVEFIMNDSAPDGASDPWSSAPKGSLHFRGNATDDQSPLYVKVDDGVVSVRLTGACGCCSMSTQTLKYGVERMLKSELPEVKEVVAV